MKQKLLFFCLFSVFILNSCTPPNGWQPSGYLKANYGSNSKNNFSNKSLTIRVLLHKGAAQPIFSNKKLYFENNKEVSNNSIIPSQAGFIVSEDNILIFEKNSYYGKIEVKIRENQFVYINHVPINEYIVSVIGHEMSKSWPLEALKAQAVVSRTYALEKININKNNEFDIDKTIAHQVYKGIIENAPTLYQAVKETNNEIITYKGNLAKVFFFASCGGVTSSSEEIWSESIPYLIPVKVDSCGINPEYRWNVKISINDLNNLLKSKIQNIEISERTISGRAKQIKIISSNGEQLIDANKFRLLIGSTKIKSTLFGIRILNEHLEIAGRGYGHGVGMCQNGAKELAEKKNTNYKEIILKYFTKVSISK